jgi:putative drug exporter of the RND superfamily
VGVSGDAAPQTQSRSPTQALGILIAFLVLAIGSLLAAGMRLLTAVIAVGIGLTGIMTAGAFVGLSSAVISLAAMLGLAVGIGVRGLLVQKPV